VSETKARRLAVRRRLIDYSMFVRANGRINRADIARIGEVSITQASADIAALIEDYPNLDLIYDSSRKTFVSRAWLKPTVSA
jgi:hypothetical protein